MTLYKVMAAGQLNNDSSMTVNVAGKKIMVARVDDQLFAVDDTCTHEECSLGTEGFLDGSAVICGCHGASYDLTNGKMLALPATGDLQSYIVTESDGYIYLQL